MVRFKMNKSGQLVFLDYIGVFAYTLEEYLERLKEAYLHGSEIIDYRPLLAAMEYETFINSTF